MQRSKVLWPAPSRVVGTVILAFCSYVPLTHASVIVDNTPNFTLAGNEGAGDTLAQVFTMPVLTGSYFGGNISSLSLVMAGSGLSDVYVYNATLGGPTTPLYSLGSVDAGSGIVTISSSSDFLTAGQTYAIEVVTGASADWLQTASSGSGSGSLGGAYFASGSGQDVGVYYGMDLQAVPEVPMTGVVMGFGALTVGLGHTLRRKLVSVIQC